MPKDIYLYGFSSAPRSEVFGAPQRKGMRWGQEERTSPPEYPDPQIHMDDPTPFECDVISKTPQCS